MRIICCYVGKPHVRTLESVERYAPLAKFFDTGADRMAYWRVIKDHWNGSEDLMTIEQDIEIKDECVSSFENCPKLWCVYAYAGAGVIGKVLENSLGCTRFRKEIMEEVTASEIEASTLTVMSGFRIPSMKVGGVPWDRIDWRIASHLQDHGYRPHVHGEVRHYHPYPDAGVNGNVQATIEAYLKDEITIDSVAQVLDWAHSGELNANPMLL